MSVRIPETSVPRFESENGSEKKLTLTYVDISDAVESHAIDAAESQLTADKSELKGVGGFLKKVWKYNIAYDFYRKKEIDRARERITETGNLYVNDTSDLESTAQAKHAILERFTHESEELIAADAGEKREKVDGKVKAELKSALAAFVDGRLDESGFEEEKNRVLSAQTGLKNAADARVRYADNMLEVARHIKSLGHIEAMRAIDQDLELTAGVARTGVRTEANLTKLDKALEWVKKSSKVGAFLVSSTGIATALSIASCVLGGITKRALYAGAVGFSGMLGIGVAGGVLAGLGRGRLVKMDRKTHSRQMAQGKTFDTETAEQRAKYEKVRYQTAEAMGLVNNLNGLLFERTMAGALRPKENLSKEEVEKAVTVLAELDARDILSNRKKIDLLSYSDITKVEQERTAVLVMKAQAKKALLRYTHAANYEQVRDEHMRLLEGEQSSKDAAFKTLKRNEQLHAGLAGFATGMTIGVAASSVFQELAAGFRSDQEGLVEHGMKWFAGKPAYAAEAHGATVAVEHPTNSTGLEGLRRFLFNDYPQPPVSPKDAIAIPGHPNHFFAGPKGSSLVAAKGGEFNLVHNGTVLAEHISFDKQGNISEIAKLALADKGIHIQDTHSVAKHLGAAAADKSAAEATVNGHPNLFHSIKRTLWYDNDTPGIFDKNELKLWWGGKGGAGVDTHGNYVFNVQHMMPHGSYHHGTSVDAQDAFKSGALKMLLSLSRGTQGQVVEVPIDSHGNAIIDPNSEIGKLFFKTDAHGHAIFLGKFAEVAQTVGHTKAGIELDRILATHIGKEAAPALVDVPQIVHGFDIQETELPLPIPAAPKNPLERIHRKKKVERAEGYYGMYGYYGEKAGDYGLLPRSDYRKRMDARLLSNPDLDLSGDDGEIVNDYLKKQQPGYINELEEMGKSQEPMDSRTNTVITIPAFQEGKNLEKTLRAYASMKDHDTFEIVILENHSRNVARDSTPTVIEKMRQEFPSLKIIHLYKVFDEKPTIGAVRKYLVDSVLLRKSQAGIEKSLPIASNDADLERISPNYANVIASSFAAQPRLDALAAKWDYPEVAYKKFPLMHAAQRVWHYMDIAFRRYFLKSGELIGRNSAFRSGAYAAIGGYNEKAKLAEDMEIGWLIKEARNHTAGSIGYANAAWLESNPRRAAGKMVSGIPIAHQYGDFHENESIRGFSWQDMLAEKRDFDPIAFQKNLQAVYDMYSAFKESRGGWLPKAQEHIIDKSFERALRFAGIEATIVGGSVTPTNVDDFVQKLESSKRPEKKS